MTDRQSNWLDMFRAVNQFYLDNQAELDLVPARTTAFATHLANIVAIENKAGLQTTNTTGTTQDKQNLRTALENSTFSHIKPAAAYAVSVSNNDLKAQMDYEISHIRDIKDDTFGPWAQMRLDLITPIIASLADYGLTPASLADWQNDITALIAAASSPRNAIVNKAGHTSTLKTLFADSNAFLDNTLDNLMSPYRASNEELFFNYRSAREIIDRGHGPSTPPTPTPDPEPEPEPEPVTGNVNGGEVQNILGPANPEWVDGVTLTIRNTTTGPAIGGLNFYPAYNPGDGWDGSGAPINPGDQMTVTVSGPEYKPYLNVYNPGPNPQTFEITFE